MQSRTQDPKTEFIKNLAPQEVLQNVKALPHTAPYKIHRYFARRPWNVFEKIINTFTSPGDLILDPFMGGGVTIYEGLKLGRKVVGFDLNPLSHFIVTSMIQTDLNLQKIDEYFLEISKKFAQLVESVSTESDQGVLWKELTYEVECNFCGRVTLLSNEFKVSNGKYRCLNELCDSHLRSDPTIKPKDCKRVGITYLYSVKKNIFGHNSIIEIDEEEKQRISHRAELLANALEVKSMLDNKTIIPKNWDRQKEDLLEQKGFKYFEDFFTATNLTKNLGLRRIIVNSEIPENYRKFFRLVFSSSLRDTNVMAFTNEHWQSGKPTTWSRHAYWLPSQFCEVDVLEAFKRAFLRARNSLIFSIDNEIKPAVSNNWTEDENISAYVINGSLADSKIAENSVDAIITDPPYGSNVQYLELSHFWYPWNKDLYQVNEPDFSQEAVSNRKSNFNGSKSMIDYEENLYKVFKKSFQVLKPGGVLTLTFNNKDMGAWLALLISIFRSGFTLNSQEIYFQDGVKNYKQTSHTRAEGSPYGDFIYVFRKPNKEREIKQKYNIQEFIVKMDNIFMEFNSKKIEKFDRYDSQKNLFTKAIPLIQAISTSSLIIEDKQILFKHFDKKYLDVFYE
jgi:putative DNA methylase